jgi:adenylate cyclase
MSGHEGPEFNFLETLKRRTLFRVALAYLGTAWFFFHVVTVIGETFEPVHHLMRGFAYLLTAGLPVTVFIAWLMERRAHREHAAQAATAAVHAEVRSRKLGIVVAIVVILAIAAIAADRWIFHRPTEHSMLALMGLILLLLVVDRLFYRGAVVAPVAAVSTSNEPRVAILPFVDMSADKDQDYFCEGTAEEIINALCSVSGLRVASRSASFQLKNRSVDSKEVGRLLNVQSFLEGSVRKYASLLRITAQLINVADGFHLWSQTFDRKVEDIFAIQEEIARHVTEALCVRLLASDAQRLKRSGTQSAEAYDFYLRGRQLLHKEKEVEQRAAAELFRRAIKLDPRFANAQAGLADVLARLLRQRAHIEGTTSADAIAAADRAVALAPDLPEGHVARGNSLQLVPDLDGAERAFERALALNPRHFDAHYWFAKFFAGRGHHEQAAEHYEAAYEIRPDDYRPITLAIQEYQAIGDTAREHRALQRAWQSLERHMALDPEDSYAADHAAGVLMLLGRREESTRLLERAIALRPDDYSTLYTAACTLSLGGDYERALEFLDRAVGTGRGNKDWILNDNDLAPLHVYPRFREIVAKLA